MIVGLTGGIGCGKSTVAQLFAMLGWLVLSADTICHDIYRAQDTELYAAISTRWGSKVFLENGLVNNKAIAKIVFNNSDELDWLNGQLHPLIKARANDFINQNSDHEKIIFEIPLLFEAGWEKFTDRVITVWAEPDIVIKRLVLRGLLIEEATARMNHQVAPSNKLSKADFGLINNGNIENLFEQCKTIDKQLN